MKFVRSENGGMVLENKFVAPVVHKVEPTSTAFIVDIPNAKASIKARSKNFLKNSNFALAPLAVGTTGFGNIDSDGLIWNTFLEYIFPWMLDVAKVYCLIRIAQAFYEERRGGKDGGTGFQALITHGKWYLIFWLLPVGVELIDQIGHKMFIDMHDKAIIPTGK